MERDQSTLAWGVLAAMAVAAPAPARGGGELTVELVASFNEPTFLTAPPGGDARLFVLERRGDVRIIENGQVRPVPFLCLRDRVDPFFEGGLLGMAFDPGFAESGRFYVAYTTSGDPLVSVVEGYQVSPDPDIADPDSARTVIRIAQPAGNHDAGWIGFSPIDRFLYVPLGDGGFSGSGPQRAQDLTDQLLGKILRLDVDGDDFPADPDRNYAIPPDNPYVGIDGDDEIWARGLRNPFRCSFDTNGDLWIADVGAGAFEEINHQPASSAGGENYGWGCMEGFTCNGDFCTCHGPDLTLPVHAYPHAEGCAVTAAAVYRGCAIPQLDGTFFFADHCSDRIWSFRLAGGKVTEFTERTDELGPIRRIVAFAPDGRGELHIVSLEGDVFRIVPAGGGGGTCFPLGDVNRDGEVDVQDLLQVLSAWGPCQACPEDLDRSGAVDFADLLIVLGHWT